MKSTFFRLNIQDVYILDNNSLTYLASETNDETTTSIEETDTKIDTVTVFGDNFVDIDSSDKNANLSSIEKEDKLADSFEPLQDSKEYIGKTYHLLYLANFCFSKSA